ncbi:sigma-70 family RNA polymerase sigma factor [Flammeovirgaceae bacterium SG7u.111]|nr:sigma-70 family RNA polymerase sigma factor [Flammeovirgaceae bacterium SG7u.132]WPO36663.1 sigma-70 family RNA polymerase sigma factor [Flammeovirgaceae bacterium SG7u.111]
MEDITLWEAYKNGDRNAFASIYDLHIRILYKYGSKFTSKPELVEDAIQDLFLDLWKNRETIGETDSIKYYLLGALRRRIIRKTQKDSRYSPDDELENYDFDLEPNMEESLIASELKAGDKTQLANAMAQLSKRQKEAVYLKFFQEMDYEEMAKTMNMNYQSVRNLVYSALKILRENVTILQSLLLFWFFGR